MKLFSVTFTTFGNAVPTVAEIPALDGMCAIKKIARLVHDGKLYISGFTTVTVNGENVVHECRVKISGVVMDAEATELSHLPKRQWDEKKAGWIYTGPNACKDDPKEYAGRGRTIASDTKKHNADPYKLTDLKNFRAGWEAATRDFSSKCKSHQTKMKSAMKTFNPTDFPRNIYEFQEGYERQWMRLAKLLKAKPVTAKKASKPRKTAKIAS